eukprot:TRINITY_DN10299_c0_g1_i2.p2 TRINITY_DN10299_c0_g1~~TRINITY_DN10299_c0_g1_i2.p2  ORF type:complete len:169 (+),score=44.40 TRINITY_DN10299_c0_g1_i2:960-1466(+)
MRRVVSVSPPTTITLRGLGVSPNFNKPRVLFVSLTDPGSIFLERIQYELRKYWSKRNIPLGKGGEKEKRVVIGRWNRDQSCGEEQIRKICGCYTQEISSFVPTRVTLYNVEKRNYKSQQYQSLFSVPLRSHLPVAGAGGGGGGGDGGGDNGSGGLAEEIKSSEWVVLS